VRMDEHAACRFEDRIADSPVRGLADWPIRGFVDWPIRGLAD
jgi:hypothetical protein